MQTLFEMEPLEESGLKLNEAQRRAVRHGEGPLLVTAGEMKRRVVKTSGERGKAVTLATFHSFCETLLKDTDPQRVLLGKEDHWILLRRNLGRMKLDKYRQLAEPGEFLNDFVEFFSRCQDELVSAEDYQQYANLLERELESER